MFAAVPRQTFFSACRFSHNEFPRISRLGVSPGLAVLEPGLTPKRLIKSTGRFAVLLSIIMRKSRKRISHNGDP